MSEERLPADAPSEEQLIEFIRYAAECLRNPPSGIAQQLGPRLTRLYGICAQAIRFADTWPILVEHGHAREAAAVARCALEHAINAQWIFFTPGVLETLDAYLNADMKRYYTDLATWNGLDDLFDAVSARPGEHATLPNFSKRMASLDVNHALATDYRAMSRVMHTTFDVVASFVRPNDVGGMWFNPDPAPGFRYVSARVAATAAMLGLAIFAEHLESDLLLRDLNRRSNELILPMFLNDQRTDEIRALYD